MTAITVRQGSDLATFLPPAYLERVYESVWSHYSHRSNVVIRNQFHSLPKTGPLRDRTSHHV